MEEIQIIHNKVDEAIAIMKEVAEWGRKKGLRVWLDKWLTKEELLSDEAQPFNFCVGKVGDESACAFILQETDSEYWASRINDKAVYLHKLCVRREFSHRNMTKQIIEAIKTECKINGKKYIRLDTNLAEKIVRKIYLDAGFKIVKIIDYDNGQSMALYEMEI